MTPERAKEIRANLDRAELSLAAAREMVESGFHDFAASRAYYAAFYAATALLLNEGVELAKHSGVIASIHQRFVKSGKLSKEQGKNLNWLFELRNIGDYGGIVHVSQQQAQESIKAADSFLHAVITLIDSRG